MLQLKREFVCDHSIDIVLPSDYDPTGSYRTIYLQDGGNGAKQALNYIDHLTRTDQIEPLILVGITPLDRNEEYTPWPAVPLVSGRQKAGGQAKKYLDLLVNEVKPLIDAKYATNPDVGQTAIGGCSFGGLLAVLASYYYPEVFQDYIILSASFWYEGMRDFMEGKNVSIQDQTYQKPVVDRQKQRLFLSVGALEGIIITVCKKIWSLIPSKPIPRYKKKVLMQKICALRSIQKARMMCTSLVRI